MAPKQSVSLRVSTRTTAATAPRDRSSHMNQNRCWPGVPNTYNTRSAASVMRPKSIATVVEVLPGVALRSSTSMLAAVITASVRSGWISDTAPTNVVLPTPNPPATTILADVVRSERAKSTEHPFDQVATLVPRRVPAQRGVHRNKSLVDEVA